MKTLEKLFTPFSLLIINVVVILAAELVGEGTYFHDSGWIHGIAVLFVLLALSRVFSRYELKDQILKQLLDLSLMALFVFAVSHLIEFFGMKVFGEYEDHSFVNVINMYLAGLLLIFGGTEYVLGMARKRSRSYATIAIALGALFVGLTAVSLFSRNPELISLDTAGAAPYLYLIAIFAVSFFAFLDLREIKKSIPLLENFSSNMNWAISFITAAAAANALYELLEEVFKLQDVQIIYFSHFVFYAAISMMFLAFGKIRLTGMYAEAENKKES